GTRHSVRAPPAAVICGTDGLGRPSLLGAVYYVLRLPLYLLHGPRLRQSGSGAAHPGLRRQLVRALSDQRANGGHVQISGLNSRSSARRNVRTQTRSRASARGAVASKLSRASPPPPTVQTAAIQAAGPTSVAKVAR